MLWFCVILLFLGFKVFLKQRHSLGPALQTKALKGLPLDGQELGKILGTRTEIPGVAVLHDEPVPRGFRENQHGGST